MQTLTPGEVSLTVLENLWRTCEPAIIDRSARAAIKVSADVVSKAAKGETAVYGVNTFWKTSVNPDCP